MKGNVDTLNTVIWDLGGVILRTLDQSGRVHWEKKLGLPSRKLEELVFEGEMGRKASLGQASPDQVWKWVIERLNLPQESGAQLERDFWKGDFIDDGLVQFIRNLRPKYQVGLLSNAWPDLRDALENTWQIADVFDEIVISAEVGMVKPDERIYKHILDRMKTKPEESVFVDDFPQNVAGAQAVGMHAIQFQDPKQTIRELGVILHLT